MKILVTGGGGFIGRRVVEQLLDVGHSLRSFGRQPQPGLQALGVEVRCGDLADRDAVAAACEGMDAVFHVAAKAGVWGPRKAFFEANVLGSRHVVAGCRKHGVPRLVYTSTPSVVFNRKAIRGGDERMPYGSRWLCHYAETKALAERETLAAADEGFGVVALRPHLVFGPGDPHLLPRVVQSAIAGRIKIVGHGRNKVDVAYIEDVARAHRHALEALERQAMSGSAYFITQGEPIRLWPWLNEILEALGHAPLTGKVALPLAYAAGGLLEGIWGLSGRKGEPPLTRFVAVELAKDHWFSIERARRELSYKPCTAMEVAVEATVGDLRARGFGK